MLKAINPREAALADVAAVSGETGGMQGCGSNLGKQWECRIIVHCAASGARAATGDKAETETDRSPNNVSMHATPTMPNTYPCAGHPCQVQAGGHYVPTPRVLQDFYPQVSVWGERYGGEGTL